MHGPVRETKGPESQPGGSQRRIMRNPSQRDDYPNLGQGGELRFEECPACGDLARQRLILRGKAFDAVDDDSAVEGHTVVDACFILTLAQTESGERREQQIAGIIAGEGPSRAVGAMLAGCEPHDSKPGMGITKGRDRRIPPVRMLGPARIAQRHQPRAARTIAWRFGTGKRAGNRHPAAIGAAA